MIRTARVRSFAIYWPVWQFKLIQYGMTWCYRSHMSTASSVPSVSKPQCQRAVQDESKRECWTKRTILSASFCFTTQSMLSRTLIVGCIEICSSGFGQVIQSRRHTQTWGLLQCQLPVVWARFQKHKAAIGCDICSSASWCLQWFTIPWADQMYDLTWPGCFAGLLENHYVMTRELGALLRGSAESLLTAQLYSLLQT